MGEREILGQTKSIRKLLGDKFAIDYYQREYRWEKKHVKELLDDLSSKFLESHEPDNERKDVENYEGYFLGSIIISKNDGGGRKYIIDGQQRLTSITLILIYLYHQLEDDNLKRNLAGLICSTQFGEQSYNIDIEERRPCMEALFKKTSFDGERQTESVKNICERFKDIKENFPSDLDETLPFFADWLIEKVHFVEITAYSDSDAYTIFETMNDRGLSLTPTEMLKSYLLANIDNRDRDRAKKVWRERVEVLNRFGKNDKNEDANAIKAWLRAQYAESIREGKIGAKPQDFDLISTEFHRWVRKNEKRLGLKQRSDFIQFIEKDFKFYTDWYEQIYNATTTLTHKLEAIFYNANNNFTLQFPALLAPLKVDDDKHEVARKLYIVSRYIDIVIARRIWDSRNITHKNMVNNIYETIKEIRRKSSDELVNIFVNRLEEEESFESNNFRLHSQNRSKVHYLLARMTDYIETKSNQPSRYIEYIQRGGKSGYQIEHIWADNFDRHRDEFDHKNDFDEYRNRIGGLLLLPKSFNASYGNKAYEEKRERYIKHNLLAQSLHEKAYENDPGFQKFIRETSLSFHPHSEFKKADISDRQELICQLAKKIWSPNVLYSAL